MGVENRFSREQLKDIISDLNPDNIRRLEVELNAERENVINGLEDKRIDKVEDDGKEK